MCLGRNPFWLASFVLLLSLAGGARAETWTNADATGLWDNGLNWDPNSVPFSENPGANEGTDALIDSSPGPIVEGAGMSARYIDLRGTEASDLTIDGGDLTAYYLNIGH